MDDTRLATVMLVHGAWHGPWCWELVVAGLQARGVATLTPELPLSGFTANVAAVRDALDMTDGPVVLCGHSGAGNVITAAGSGAENVSHLVYLCALMLDEGVGSPASRRPTLIAAAQELRGDKLTINPAAAYDLFYGDCPPVVASAAVERLRPVTVGDTPETSLVRRAAWRDIHSTYVVCAMDQSLHPDDQREMAAPRAGNVIEWPTAHSPFLSRPELVVGLLYRLARS